MNDVIEAQASYKLIRLLFQHESESSERVIREYIQALILKKRVRVLAGAGSVNDREDANRPRRSQSGAVVSR